MFKFYFFLNFYFYLFLSTQNFLTLQNHKQKRNQEKTHGCTDKWPDRIHEKNIVESPQEICVDEDHCRTWEHMKNIAYCKSLGLQEILPEHSQMLYVRTDYKTENEDEWAKFIFSDLNRQYDNKGKEKSYSILYRICVPVSKKVYSWVDSKCPQDACGDYDKMFDKPCKMSLPRNRFSEVQSNKDTKNPKQMLTTQTDQEKQDPLMASIDHFGEKEPEVDIEAIKEQQNQEAEYQKEKKLFIDPLLSSINNFDLENPLKGLDIKPKLEVDPLNELGLSTSKDENDQIKYQLKAFNEQYNKKIGKEVGTNNMSFGLLDEEFQKRLSQDKINLRSEDDNSIDISKINTDIGLDGQYVEK